jgi:hypothetical protein
MRTTVPRVRISSLAWRDQRVDDIRRDEEFEAEDDLSRELDPDIVIASLLREELVPQDPEDRPDPAIDDEERPGPPGEKAIPWTISANIGI